MDFEILGSLLLFATMVVTWALVPNRAERTAEAEAGVAVKA